MRLAALIAVLVGVVGASWSWHLLQWYLSANTLTACIIGTQCPLVFQTSFSYFYGVPIHLLAVGWFSLMTLIAAVRAYGVLAVSRIGVAIGALCVPAIIYLDYIQLVVLSAQYHQITICSDCELAHFLGLILFIIFIAIFRADRKLKQ